MWRPFLVLHARASAILLFFLATSSLPRPSTSILQRSILTAILQLPLAQLHSQTTLIMPRFQPPMDIHPASVSIGSVIPNLNRPDKPLSTFTPVLHEWTESTDPSRANKPHSHDGFNDATLQADTLLFATTAKNVTGQLPPTGQNSPRVSFSAGEITTRRFVPSANYVRAAVTDHEVGKFFEAGRSQARAYLIVGVQVARDMTVVCRDPVDGATRGGMAGRYHRAEYPGPVLLVLGLRRSDWLGTVGL